MKIIKLSVLSLTLFSMLAIPKLVRAENPLEQIALTLLADKFGFNLPNARDFQSRSDLSVFDAAPVYSTSYYTHRPINEVWELRQQGLGWGQIAHRLGMHPGTFNKLRKSGAFDRDAIWGSIYKDRYGVRESDLATIRRRGGSMRDALPACIIAKASRNSPVTVYRRYQRDHDWDRTANSYKVDWQNHSKYAARSGKPHRTTANSVGKGHDKPKGNAHRKDRGNQSDHVIGPGKSHGKGSAGRSDHGKGYGKGHGKNGDKVHGKGGR